MSSRASAAATRPASGRVRATARLIWVAGALTVGAIAPAGCLASEEATPSPSTLPSGALGVIRPADVERALTGLCSLSAMSGGDRDEASDTFLDEVHGTLHVIIAAVEPTDREAAATLQLDKARVEADLEGRKLPASFAHDIASLTASTRGALSALGVEAPECVG